MSIRIILSIFVSLVAVTNIALAQVASPSNAVQAGKQYFLLIGINQYRYLPYLGGSINNVTALADVLRSSNKFGEITVLTDSNANKANIINVINSYKLKLTANDNLLIYYSGHGGLATLSLQEKVRRDPAKTRENIFDETIMPIDATYRLETQITNEELTALLQKLPTWQITIVSDNSYNRSMIASAVPSFNSPNAPRRPRSSLRDMNMFGYNVIMASDCNEAAWNEYFMGKEQSVFTHYLVEGIRTHIADVNQNGVITVAEIFNYARNRTVQYIGNQHPYLYKGRDPEQIVVQFK